MAPPTAVLKRDDIVARYDRQLSHPEKYDCQLKSITQHECTFKVSSDRSQGPEIICLPFKRLFQHCLVPTVTLVNGVKKSFDRRVAIEVTDGWTNRDLVEMPKYSKDVAEFLQAEKELQRLMESESQSTL